MAEILRRMPELSREARGARALDAAVWFFAAALLLHGADHLRRGVGGLPPEVFWGGTLLTLVAAAAIALVLTRYRGGPLLAAAVGFATALVVAAAHLLPRWSVFSDAFPGATVDAWSWAAVLVEIAGALAFGTAGVYRWSTNQPNKDSAGRA